MAPRAIPDRWLNYQPVGERVDGTRFIAFKVPLREQLMESVQDDLRLSCDSLLKKIPNIGMIIDLTNTNRYYDPYFFIQRGIQYQKLMIPGHQVPPENLVQMFKKMVRDYLKENANNTKLIGVHCTHGVNRTGYLICNFMVSEMKINPDEAIRSFEEARGHLIERENYRNDLIHGISSNNERNVTNWRQRSRSPHRPKSFRMQPYHGETTRNWRSTDLSHTSRQSRAYSIYQNQEDDSNRYSQKRWRAHSRGNAQEEYQSFDYSSQPMGADRRNYQSRYQRPRDRQGLAQDLS